MLRWLKSHRWLKIGLIIFGLALAFLAFAIVRPDTYLPHKRIVLRVPYDLSDPPTSILPMGEKIYHANAPQGHPGIDFQWEHAGARILASAAGTITAVKQTPEHFNDWDIEVSSWPYVVRYKELLDYDSNLKKGSRVIIGQFLGHASHSPVGEGRYSNQLHWEFGSSSLLRDRFCPMTYFDTDSRDSVEAIWAKSTWQYKNRYPDVCSGDYANKTD